CGALGLSRTRRSRKPRLANGCGRVVKGATAGRSPSQSTRPCTVPVAEASKWAPNSAGGAVISTADGKVLSQPRGNRLTRKSNQLLEHLPAFSILRTLLAVRGQKKNEMYMILRCVKMRVAYAPPMGL